MEDVWRTDSAHHVVLRASIALKRPPSGLLISCAMPEASRPKLASFSSSDSFIRQQFFGVVHTMDHHVIATEEPSKFRSMRIEVTPHEIGSTGPRCPLSMCCDKDF